MKAPASIDGFRVSAQDGSVFDSSEALAKGPLVIFFYPKASSPVCTLQSCAFRDASTEFAHLGAAVVGVSNDKADAQNRFDTKHTLGMPLLADTEGLVAKQFGVKRKFGLPPKRASFVVGQDRRILGEFYSELDGPGHSEWALEFLKNLQK